MVITLGGDGTILHTSHLFGEGECPPVLSFSMGSLGFLLPFRKSLLILKLMSDIDSMGKTLETTLDGPVSLLNRMRLACMPITREGTALECAKPGMSFTYDLRTSLTRSRRCRMASDE
jgi:NADH kinase